jgi:hypothetical protein
VFLLAFRRMHQSAWPACLQWRSSAMMKMTARSASAGISIMSQRKRTRASIKEEEEEEVVVDDKGKGPLRLPTRATRASKRAASGKGIASQ